MIKFIFFPPPQIVPETMLEGLPGACRRRRLRVPLARCGGDCTMAQEAGSVTEANCQRADHLNIEACHAPMGSHLGKFVTGRLVRLSPAFNVIRTLNGRRWIRRNNYEEKREVNCRRAGVRGNRAPSAARAVFISIQLRTASKSLRENRLVRS